MSPLTDDYLIEEPAIPPVHPDLDWDVVNFDDEWSGGVSNKGRYGKRTEVVSRFQLALPRLNPYLPVEELTRDRTALRLMEASREIYKLPKEGVKLWLPPISLALAIRRFSH